ncbi:Rv2578c family radical SAM protein [Actinomadura verrucosospora]|uniref:Radical SAM domain-containing protein n=1 Tax=Actinomadura verrucosospora TaxID=46165 RepID=A0A7D3VUC2_ACTVE|nr:Rv2578c family radical SAM protein [Actinomadura verrucosospora]QKG19012.1 radical SAM domain-containing protein [Actinomadura verrucosospora]
MRWDHLRLSGDDGGGDGAGGAALPLIERGAVARTFDTPEFRGMTFYEVRARSVINAVPKASRMPFRWTINPYRGCTHACVYCFARKTHEYLEMDAGADFDSRIVVKVNAAERVRAELAAPRWRGEHIAMGTNVDCYQRAEGRYRLMPGIIAALRDAANPFSILTKGSLILRDLPLLQEAAERAPVSAAMSVGSVDAGLWRLVEPGTPSPRKRLEVCARLNEAGIGCSVLMGPVIPYLSDSPAQLEAAVRQAAEAGATSVSAITLHLRPGAREWFTAWLREHHPQLVVPYARLYGAGAYAPQEYQRRISARVRELADRYGVGAGRRGPSAHRRVPAPPAPPAAEQLSLL